MKCTCGTMVVIRKAYPVLIISLLLATACTGRRERILSEAGSMLDTLQHKYAPDTRIALWNLDLSVSEKQVILKGEVDQEEAYRGILNSLDEHFPSIEAEIRLLPEGESDRLVNGLVNNSVANFRSQPSSLSELVNQALLGTPVRILKQEDDRFLVQTPNRYIGWVNDYEVRPVDREGLIRFREALKVVYNEQYGFSYSEPDEASLPVSDLVIGCMLPVTSSERGFYQVRYPDGRTAWVKQDEVIPAEELFGRPASMDSVALAIIKTALRFHGIPYLWGGISSKALDCSGLTSTAYFMNGILLPRDADQQSHCGREITTTYDYTELETGDLLFFGRRATEERPERVTHVAIFKGDTEFIHAAGYRDRVSINSMESTRDNYIDSYPDIFVRAVRILGEEQNGFEPVAENRFYREIFNFTP